MALKAYMQLMYMALATWTTHVVAAQKVSEALSHLYARSATHGEYSMREPAALRSGC